MVAEKKGRYGSFGLPDDIQLPTFFDYVLSVEVTSSMVENLTQLANPDKRTLHKAWLIVKKELKANLCSSKPPLSLEQWSSNRWKCDVRLSESSFSKFFKPSRGSNLTSRMSRIPSRLSTRSFKRNKVIPATHTYIDSGPSAKLLSLPSTLQLREILSSITRDTHNNET
jgi:hypothetical protein